MRYRPLGPDGDYTFGVPFLVNTPACVGQAVLTRLKLWKAEWFVDVTDGTDWAGQVEGKRYGNPDAEIQRRILGTPGATAIVSYSGTYDGETRGYTVNATVDTLYSVNGVSTTTISAVL
jgi:hypothetical protein